jgi:hypothetical protein
LGLVVLGGGDGDTAVGDAPVVPGGSTGVVTTESVVGAITTPVVVGAAEAVVEPVTVAVNTAAAVPAAGGATGANAPVVVGPSFIASGYGFSKLPTEPSGPVDTPSRNRAAVAAPRIAPSANRPCPPSCASTLCTYRLHSVPSSGSG